MEALALLQRARQSTPSWSLKGRIYENLSKYAIENRYRKAGLNNISLVGQAGDRGVDLVARWGEISVMIQCKSSVRKPSGLLWRDLAGIYQLNQPHKTLMVLVTPAPMTSQALTEFSSSSSALMHCLLPLTPLSATQLSDLPPISASFLNGAARKLLQQEGIYEKYAKCS